MICVDKQTAEEFIKSFNAENDKKTTPSWYMYAQDKPSPFKPVNEKQAAHILGTKTVWLSTLKKIK